MLEHEGDEVVCVTTEVRYAPNSRFARHVHEVAEDLFVLEGEFVSKRDGSVTVRPSAICQVRRGHLGQRLAV